MDLVDTGFRIAFDIGNTGGVAVVWRRTYSGPLEFAKFKPDPFLFEKINVFDENPLIKL